MRKIIFVFLLGCLISVGCLSSSVLVCAVDDNTTLTDEDKESDSKEMPDLGIKSKSVILMEAKSGTVIYEKNADEQLKPASVTKVMTLLLIFEEIESGNLAMEDIVTVTEHAASMGGSQCFFEPGEQQTVHDMIKCIEVSSGNDAAVAMAEHISGNEAMFVEKMNQRAKELGMINTSFKNACGLDAEGHFTSARDIAIMSRELMVNHPDIMNYSTIWMDHITHKTTKGESRFDLANTNKFLKQYNGATGLKTGYTSQAKYCISATAMREDLELIAVIMGAETKEIRNSEIACLLDYGFSVCSTYTDNMVLSEKTKFPVKYGVKDVTKYKCAQEKNISVIDGNPEQIIKEIIVYNNIEAPVREGDIIGVVQYSYEGKLIDEEFIYSAEDIQRKTYSYALKNIASRIFMAK